MADGETFSTGRKTWLWLDTPQSQPWGTCGVLFDRSTGTLLCGDLFTQAGAETPPVTESEVLTASEAMREPMDYYAHSARTGIILERLTSLNPTTLACQHGSVFRGDGAGRPLTPLQRRLIPNGSDLSHSQLDWCSFGRPPRG